jgi:hypothetical protein
VINIISSGSIVVILIGGNRKIKNAFIGRVREAKRGRRKRCAVECFRVR